MSDNALKNMLAERAEHNARIVEHLRQAYPAGTRLKYTNHINGAEYDVEVKSHNSHVVGAVIREVLDDPMNRAKSVGIMLSISVQGLAKGDHPRL